MCPVRSVTYVTGRTPLAAEHRASVRNALAADHPVSTLRSRWNQQRAKGQRLSSRAEGHQRDLTLGVP
jgi:hypothetical protein